MQLGLVERMGAVEARWLRQVAALAAELQVSAWLVGGAVRDALLGCQSLDLDITVEVEAAPLAQALAAATGGRLTSHERFGTHVVEAGEFHFDIATARRETYPHPGALPVVEPASLEADLRRRDFTINAIALRLDADLETLYDPLEGVADLQRQAVRALHPVTFSDDPTRIIRAARYAARLGYAVEPQTQAWLDAAVVDGALGLVTGPRIWGELSRLLAEPSAPEAMGLLAEWGALDGLGLALTSLAELRELFAANDSPAPLTAQDRAFAALGLLAGDQATTVANHFCLSGQEREAVVAAAQMALQPPRVLFAENTANSTLYHALLDTPPAARLALWVRHTAARASLQRFANLAELRPDINGQDLQQLGFAPSPGFKIALAEALRVRLDEDATKERQLATAREALLNWQREHEL